MSDRRQVTIHSDGYGGSGTVILDESGKRIDTVRSVVLEIEAGAYNEAVLTIQGVLARVDATVKVIVFECPLCTHIEEHTCDQTLGDPLPVITGTAIQQVT